MKTTRPWSVALQTGAALFLIAGPSLAQSPYHADIAAGYNHTLALWCDGSSYAAGLNSFGQLGDGSQTDRTNLVSVQGLTNGVIAVKGGYVYSLVLLTDGTLRGFGDNTYGQLGNGSTTPALTSVVVTNLNSVIAISAGATHGLAILGNGTVRAFGNNANYQLGDGTTVSMRTTNVAVTNLSSVLAVAAGGYHSLSLMADGTVKSWGWNFYNQLGDGTGTQRKSPVQVTDLSSVAAVAAGGYHSLALHSNGTVVAWGRNSSGALGDGTTMQRKTNVLVVGLSNVVAIAAGWSHSLALRSDGTVVSWGENTYGQLGDSSLTQRTTNVTVVGLSNVIAIAAGGAHSIALDSAGKIWVWGYTNYGNASGGYSSVPVNPEPAVHLTWQRPAIIRQPGNQKVFIGHTAVFKVSASGTEPLSYQWSFKGTNIDGATNALLTLTSSSSTAGSYSVQVTNAVGSVVSATATLTCFNWPSIPPLPEGMILGIWEFDDTDWRDSWTGFHPMTATNVDCVPSWSVNALQVDSDSPAILQYTGIEYWGANVWPLLACDYGSLDFFFKPGWNSTNLGGAGLGSEGRLIEVGTQGGTNDWWSLYLNSAGTQLTFSAQTNGVQVDYLSVPIAWSSNDWYHVALSYSPDGSALYLDGQLVTNGLGVTVVPSVDVLTAGFRIGSDASGLTQARGQFENLMTFDYPLSDWEVMFDFDDDWPQAAAWSPSEGEQMGAGGMYSDNGLNWPIVTGVYPINSLWLQITGITNDLIYLVVNGTTQDVRYEILSKRTLADAVWGLENTITGAAGTNFTFTTISILDRTDTLFIWARSLIDSDGDGLPDWYELQVTHTDPNNPDTGSTGVPDGYKDPDADGWSNLQEYQNGTDPTVFDQPFKIIITLPCGNSAIP